MIDSSAHSERLKNFYLEKGLSPQEANVFTGSKIEKLHPESEELSYAVWLKRLLEEIANLLGRELSNLTVVDFGCGSGELVMVMRAMGLKAYGYDIYEKELRLGELLALDNHENEKIFFSSREELHGHLDGTKLDVLMSFSVLEHLSTKELEGMFDFFELCCDGCMFHLVPSKFKVTDDHTGLKFLGLFPRILAQMIVLFSRKRYALSQDGEWDVWYRSLNTYRALANKRNMDLKLVKDELVYPPLSVIPRIGAGTALTKPKLALLAYSKIIERLTGTQENLFPYLNCILIRRAPKEAQ